MAYENVLAAMARGTGFNPLGNFAEGRNRALKRQLAEQELAQQAEANRALNEYRRQSLALDRDKLNRPDISSDVQLLNAYRQDPEGVGKFLAAKGAGSNPYMIIPPGATAYPRDPNSPLQPIQGAQKPRSAASLKGESESLSKLDEIKSLKANMARAFELAGEGKSYEGGLTEFGATLGTEWPTVGGMLGYDKQKSENTKELQSILTPTSLAAMAKFLKPLSEKEGALAIRNLGNPNYPNRLKRQIIQRIQQGIDRELASEEGMLKKWQAEGGEAPAAADPPAGGSYQRPAEIDESTWGNMTPDEQRMYIEAPE